VRRGVEKNEEELISGSQSSIFNFQQTRWLAENREQRIENKERNKQQELLGIYGSKKGGQQDNPPISLNLT